MGVWRNCIWTSKFQTSNIDFEDFAHEKTKQNKWKTKQKQRERERERERKKQWRSQTLNLGWAYSPSFFYYFLPFSSMFFSFSSSIWSSGWAVPTLEGPGYATALEKTKSVDSRKSFCFEIINKAVKRILHCHDQVQSNWVDLLSRFCKLREIYNEIDLTVNWFNNSVNANLCRAIRYLITNPSQPFFFFAQPGVIVQHLWHMFGNITYFWAEWLQGSV